jgi:hypothetical protein
LRDPLLIRLRNPLTNPLRFQYGAPMTNPDTNCEWTWPEQCHDPACTGTVSQATDTCGTCGLVHGGPPCPECSATAWHHDDCSEAR